MGSAKYENMKKNITSQLDTANINYIYAKPDNEYGTRPYETGH